MAAIRLEEDQWNAILKHLYSTPGEHFAFLSAGWTFSDGQPVFIVRDVSLIRDSHVRIGPDGWEVETRALIETVNNAVRSQSALIEVHNHGGRIPRFSPTDREGFRDFVPYVLESLPGRPYAATVWGDDTVYGKYFLETGTTEIIDSITVVGNQLARMGHQSGNRLVFGYEKRIAASSESWSR